MSYLERARRRRLTRMGIQHFEEFLNRGFSLEAIQELEVFLQESVKRRKIEKSLVLAALENEWRRTWAEQTLPKIRGSHVKENARFYAVANRQALKRLYKLFELRVPDRFEGEGFLGDPD